MISLKQSKIPHNVGKSQLNYDYKDYFSQNNHSNEDKENMYRF